MTDQNIQTDPNKEELDSKPVKVMSDAQTSPMIDEIDVQIKEQSSMKASGSVTSLKINDDESYTKVTVVDDLSNQSLEEQEIEIK